jgi:hypothetical protein
MAFVVSVATAEARRHCDSCRTRPSDAYAVPPLVRKPLSGVLSRVHLREQNYIFRWRLLYRPLLGLCVTVGLLGPGRSTAVGEETVVGGAFAGPSS